MTKAEDAIRTVWNHIDRETDYATELTQDLVRIPSVNPKFETAEGLNREPEVQDRIQAEVEAMGFETERWEVFPGRPNLVSDLPGDEERSLILCGHVDVVPTGPRADWSMDPFAADIRDGCLYGRGSIDMKSGVAACLAAARAIRNAGIELGGRLSIHTVVDEEAGGFGAMDALARGKTAKGAIIAEPTNREIMPCEGGLYWVRVTIRGQQAHAGWRYNEIWPQPGEGYRRVPGVNAVELATRFLSALRDYESIRCRTTHHPLMPPGLNTINPGVVVAGAGLGEDGLPMILGNPAIIPDVAVIDLDFKFLPNETPEEVRREFEDFVHHFCQQDRWLREHPIAIKWALGDLYFPPMDTPADHPLVTSLVRHQTALGAPPAITGFCAVTDGAHYAGAGVAPVMFGPTGDRPHGVDEYVEVASIHETTKSIAGAIIDWCGLR
ncbi:ArgE/DapE family deacylase [Acidimangrovimonas sediminis]|uniref:ArgE/DapE family deacylase n=1 Tax=Acidimangrovimonas sediminis TaxID=2056283 RepID=UPI000C8017D7|nr:ArgE/DapE family deacylase [Acidimangrovimonas sediminis]